MSSVDGHVWFLFLGRGVEGVVDSSECGGVGRMGKKGIVRGCGPPVAIFGVPNGPECRQHARIEYCSCL